MKVCVTGGAGFIGSTLADRLLALGHDVLVVDDLSRGRRQQVPAAARFYPVDVAGPWLAPLLARERPAAIFHEAAQIDVRASVRDPLGDARINVLGTVNLLVAAAAAGTRRVIVASSGGAVYGDTDQVPTPERAPTRPESPYGAAKLAVEAYCHGFSATAGLETVALRYANVYGPRQDPHGEAGVVAIFAARLLAGRPCVINGDGRQTRDYVFVDDVVAANVAALEAPPGVYNVGTGVETDVREIHRLLADRAGSTAAPEPGPAQPGEQRRSAVDSALFQAATGWGPTVDLAEGLSRTLAYFGARPAGADAT
ncbi:MAG TPA: NAD-dependent epimerase/dehydratase family protein [Candidatus Dormibacteraeota bacterium]|nr:NAD-dependent epimerase/dehydratase family protein [Candidatus Dormibacteraeota bacterium]